MKPIVIYLGPSMLDGHPIVALATLGSTNAKTGPMVQTWIMRADMSPTEASEVEADSSVCGDCPRRQSTGGDCYVTLFQAPRAVWDHWWRNGCPAPNAFLDDEIGEALRVNAGKHGLRLGPYGDPAAVPWSVWHELLWRCAPKMHTGYTHQWRKLEGDLATHGGHEPTLAHLTWCRNNLMASADSPADAAVARQLGWRYFLAVGPDSVPTDGSVLCLAEREVNPRTCEQCGICNGTQGRPSRTSVHIVEHGTRSLAKHKRGAKAHTSPSLVVQP